MSVAEPKTPVKELSDQEIGKRLRRSFGMPLARQIADNPMIALGAMTGAVSALKKYMVDADLLNFDEVEILTRLYGSKLKSAKVKPSALGDARIEDALPEGERIDLSGFMRTGDFEDIWPGVRLLTTSEAAKKIGKAQSTINEWIKTGKVLALSREGKRGYRIPAEIIKRDNVLPGLAEIIHKIANGDHNFAWTFLTDQIEFEDGLARPIDLLKAGRIHDVLGQERRWGTQGGS